MSLLDKLINHHRNAKWAFADQAMVSGSNFLTGILLARFMGPEVFGIFVVVQSILLYANSFQGALIFQPMMSAAPQLPETEKHFYLKGVFALQLMLSLALAAIFALLALGATLTSFDTRMNLNPEIVFALICGTLGFQLQDWLRRYYFVQERARSAFVLDTLSYGLQFTLLVVATITGYLTVANTFWIITIGSGVAFLAGYMLEQVRPAFIHARSVLRTGWRTGRDYLAAWQFQWLGSQGILMLGASVVGTEAVGATRATQNIIGPLNILFLAMDNLVPVAAAKRYGASGLAGLSHYLWRITIWGTVLLTPTLLALAIFSEELMHLFYGEQYLAYAALVYWQAAYMFVQFYQRQSFFFLRTVNASGAILRSGIISSVISVGITALLVKDYQEVGLMIALLSGGIGSLAYTLTATHAVSKKLKKNSEKLPNNEKSSIDNSVKLGSNA